MDRRRSGARRRAREGIYARERTERPATPTPELSAQLDSMAPRDRAVLELRFVQGMTHAEVGETLGVSLRTAKSWAQAALARLAELVKAEASE